MKKVLIVLIIILGIFSIYGFFINTKGLSIKEYNINEPTLTDNFSGFKIVHFSDLLFGTIQDQESLENIVDNINKLNPDIIVFTGDLISKNYQPTNEEITSIKNNLSKLECTLYKYAVIGDNDQDNLNTYKEIMIEGDFLILDNESTLLFYKDNFPIQIIGLTDATGFEKAKLLSDEITPIYTILLSHYPDYIDNIENINLYLAGHSLGGQVKLPFVGSLIKKDGASKYIDDYYEINNTKLYISSGLGTENLPIRTFNKPSINIYRLLNH